MKRTLLVAVLLFSAAVAAAPAAGVAAESAGVEANKRVVLDFYEKVINQKDVDAALADIGPRYIQHNPFLGDGIEGLRDAIGYMKVSFPRSHSDIRAVFADGDFVILHVHAVREPGTRGSAVVDIFRLENGRIVEHWDVAQPIPDGPANNNTMF